MKANRKILLADGYAVSPVLGVMLMIVVTVILAAAVASFTNATESKDKPTSAVFDVKCSASDGLITAKHIGGDVIYKEDIKIMISHGIPKMTGYLSNENLTFYPADQETRDAAQDKTPLTAGQIATYGFDNQAANYNGSSDMEKYHANLGGQIILVGETFEFSIIDVATENTVFMKEIVMEP